MHQRQPPERPQDLPELVLRVAVIRCARSEATPGKLPSTSSRGAGVDHRGQATSRVMGASSAPAAAARQPGVAAVVARASSVGRHAPQPATTAPMRGSSAGVLTPCARPRRARRRWRRASAAGCRARRSPAPAPTAAVGWPSGAAGARLEGDRTAKAQLEAQVDEGLRLLALPLKAWAMPPPVGSSRRPLSSASALRARAGSPAGRACAPAAAGRGRSGLALAHGGFAQRGHEKVQPDLAHRHQARVVAVAVSARPARPGRRPAPAAHTAGGCPARRRRPAGGPAAHRLQFCRIHRRNDAQPHPARAPARALGASAWSARTRARRDGSGCRSTSGYKACRSGLSPLEEEAREPP
jgi:hypothetical protein